MNKTPIKILLVDDDKEFLELICLKFQEANFEIYSAVSGNMGIDILFDTDIDVIISDLEMIDGNGLKLLEYSRSKINPPLFYFVSGHEKSEVIDVLKQGAKDYFTKPLDFEKLIQLVKSEIENL